MRPTPKLDSMMLASIALMPVFVIRRKVKAKRRHKILVCVAEDFNRRKVYCTCMPACLPACIMLRHNPTTSPLHDAVSHTPPRTPGPGRECYKRLCSLAPAPSPSRSAPPLTPSSDYTHPPHASSPAGFKPRETGVELKFSKAGHGLFFRNPEENKVVLGGGGFSEYQKNMLAQSMGGTTHTGGAGDGSDGDGGDGGSGGGGGGGGGGSDSRWSADTSDTAASSASARFAAHTSSGGGEKGWSDRQRVLRARALDMGMSEADATDLAMLAGEAAQGDRDGERGAGDVGGMGVCVGGVSGDDIEMKESSFLEGPPGAGLRQRAGLKVAKLPTDESGGRNGGGNLGAAERGDGDADLLMFKG